MKGTEFNREEIQRFNNRGYTSIAARVARSAEQHTKRAEGALIGVMAHLKAYQSLLESSIAPEESKIALAQAIVNAETALEEIAGYKPGEKIPR